MAKNKLYCRIFLSLFILWVPVSFSQTFEIKTDSVTFEDQDGTYTLNMQSLFVCCGPITDRFGTLYVNFTDENNSSSISSHEIGAFETFNNNPPGSYHYFEAEACTEFLGSMVDCDIVSLDATVNVIGSDIVTQNLTIRRHQNAPPLSNFKADQIMSDASSVLQDIDSSHDVGCDVEMVKTGSVGTLSQGDGSIDSSSEWEELPNGVNVVDVINWCGSLNPSIIGCATVGGERIAVERFTESLEGILWAHEFGHNQGLQHRSNTDAIMNPFIASTARGVNDSECIQYRN